MWGEEVTVTVVAESRRVDVVDGRCMRVITSFVGDLDWVLSGSTNVTFRPADIGRPVVHFEVPLRGRGGGETSYLLAFELQSQSDRAISEHCSGVAT